MERPGRKLRMTKSCINCKHLEINLGEHIPFGRSELGSIRCNKQYFRLYSEDTIREIREELARADNCADYEEIKND